MSSFTILVDRTSSVVYFRTILRNLWTFRTSSFCLESRASSSSISSFNKEIIGSPTHKDEDFAGHVFALKTDKYIEKIIFQDEIPKTIWCYDKISERIRPSEPKPDNLLEIVQQNSVMKEIYNLSGGFCSGIGWRWE